MRGQCQAGLGKGWGRRWLVLVKGWSSSHLSIDGHSAAPGHQEAPLCKAWCASISTGIRILGLPSVSWIFGPQVHPLECRMLNLPLSLHSSDLHCPRSPTLSLIGTWSVLSWGCNPSITLKMRIKVSWCWRLACRDLWQGLYNRILTEERWRRAVCRAEACCTMDRFKVIMPQQNCFFFFPVQSTYQASVSSPTSSQQFLLFIWGI